RTAREDQYLNHGLLPQFIAATLKSISQLLLAGTKLISRSIMTMAVSARHQSRSDGSHDRGNIMMQPSLVVWTLSGHFYNRSHPDAFLGLHHHKYKHVPSF